MMKETPFAAQRPCEGLGEPFYYFASLGSTNDTAASLAQDGACHGTLVFADEQTSGRGREKRRWITPPGTALALSVILRLPGHGVETLPYAGLGAVAVSDALAELGVGAVIKWPNDVLVGNRKLSGVLAEVSWTGEQADAIILGIGVNVLPGAVPPPESIRIPATCVEWEAGHSVSREDLLQRIVCALGRRLNAGASSWMQIWEQRLAFLGQEVSLKSGSGSLRGVVRGLDERGRLLLAQGDRITPVHVSEMRMELVDRAEE